MEYHSKDHSDVLTRNEFLNTAEHSNILKMMALFVLFASALSEDTTLNAPLIIVPFNCSIDINNASWTLECTSKAFIKREFFSLKLKGIFKVTSPILCYDLLKSTLLSESEFFHCYNIMRAIIPIVELKKYCEECSMTTEDFIRKLKESFIVRKSIIHLPYLEALMTILNESSTLDEVRICNNYLPNVTDFPVRPYNSVNTLILKHNEIKNINGRSFNKLPLLRSLDLSNNYIKNVNKSLLGNLRGIRTLNLSYNLIEEIAKDAFSNMFHLKNLYLQNNKLKNVSETIFSFNNLLDVLDISNNDLEVLPPTIFHKLSDLTHISCSSCSLIKLHKFLFANSTKIKYIIFRHNHIQYIPNDLLRNLSYLVHVNLGFNRIKKLDINIFSFHPLLHFLDLDQNEITSIPSGMFDGTIFLKSLNMSGNRIEALTDEHVISFANLEHFDLSRNEIKIVQIGIMQKVFIHRFYLTDNLISNLNVKWKNLVYLESFYMDNNRLTYIDLPPCIKNTRAQNITFSFKYNKITNVKLDSLMEDEMKIRTDRKSMADCFLTGKAKNVVDLTHNPLLCDCNLFPLYTYIKGIPRRYQLETFVDEGNLTCIDPQFETKTTMTSLTDDDFNCLFTKECPLPCKCGIRSKDNATFVNCSDNFLQTFPQKLPEYTTVLYFNRNMLHSMRTFNGKDWNSLKELHLDNNSLTDLNDWNYPASLRYLSVQKNNLTTIPISLMRFIANRTDFRLYFGGNDKKCTCDREELKNFIIDNSKLIGDVENIMCEVISNGTIAFLPLSAVPDSELCPSVYLNYNQKIILISLCFFFTFLIIVMLTYYKQRQIILSFFYIHCDQLFHFFYSEEEYDQDKIFDAFVAYSSNDRAIVMDILQELENHPPYFQLCIHERNWVPGRFICDNILSSVQSSKRTIIVLSNKFITSPWFNLELRAAVSKMSEDKISRIIIILADKGVELSNVDAELRHVISKRTYLVWKESWFWEKLRYAMPRIKHIKENDTVMLSTKKGLSLMPEQA